MEDMVTSKSLTVVVISIFFTGLSFLLVVLRLSTRFKILKIHGLEDYFLMAAMIGTIGLTTLTLEQVHFGLGKHFNTLTTHEVELNLKSLWGAIMVYYFTLGLIKTSVLLQYLRIFSSDTGVRMASYILLGLVIVYSITSVVTAALSCQPVALFWNKSLSGQCVNELAFWFSNAAFNILSDLAIIIVPMPALRSLHLDRKHKIAVFGVFLIGGFTIVVSILRLQSLYIISVSTDPTFDNVGAAVWSSLECNVGIICSCLPVLRPLIAKLKLGFATEVTELSSVNRISNKRASSKPSIYTEKELPPLPAIHSQEVSEACSLKSLSVLYDPRSLEEGIHITTFYCIESESVEDLKKSVTSTNVSISAKSEDTLTSSRTGLSVIS